jgi:hypothetical protein
MVVGEALGVIGRQLVVFSASNGNRDNGLCFYDEIAAVAVFLLHLELLPLPLETSRVKLEDG